MYDPHEFPLKQGDKVRFWADDTLNLGAFNYVDHDDYVELEFSTSRPLAKVGTVVSVNASGRYFVVSNLIIEWAFPFEAYSAGLVVSEEYPLYALDWDVAYVAGKIDRQWGQDDRPAVPPCPLHREPVKTSAGYIEERLDAEDWTRLERHAQSRALRLLREIPRCRWSGNTLSMILVARIDVARLEYTCDHCELND